MHDFGIFLSDRRPLFCLHLLNDVVRRRPLFGCVGLYPGKTRSDARDLFQASGCCEEPIINCVEDFGICDKSVDVQCLHHMQNHLDRSLELMLKPVEEVLKLEDGVERLLGLYQ